MYRCRQNLLLSCLALLLACLLVGVVSAQDQQSQPPVIAKKPVAIFTASPEQIRQWVTMLSSDKFAERELAFQKLIKVGYPAVEPLRAHVTGKDLETVIRSLSILGEIYGRSFQQQDEQAQLAIEGIIEQIADANKRTVSRQAKSILDSHSEDRKKYGLKKIIALGALITYSGNDKRMADFPNQELNYVTSVILSKRWKGNDQGLKFLKRIPELYQTALNRGVVMVSGVGKHSPISEAGMKFLNQEFPATNVQIRGSACLGVAGVLSFGNKSVVVNFVKPDSAADNAGIEVSDAITHFGGKKVENFQVLVDAIAEHMPGDKVKVLLQRRGAKKPVEVTVKLQEWKR